MKPDSVEERIVAALRQIIRAVDLHSRRLVSEHGLTGPQLLALRAIERLQPVRASSVAEAVSLSRSTMTGILDRLERDGLVERQRDRTDRRTVQVALTDKGRRILAEAPSLLDEHFRRELARLPDDEQSRMLATLKQIAAMMGAEKLDAAPVLITGDVNAPQPAQATPPRGRRRRDPP